MVLMRRGAEGQIRDSILIQRAADGSCAYFKAQTDGNGTVLTDENGQAKVTPLPDGTGLDYVGEEGEFSLLIPGYVFGREYTPCMRPATIVTRHHYCYGRYCTAFLLLLPQQD